MAEIRFQFFRTTSILVLPLLTSNSSKNLTHTRATYQPKANQTPPLKPTSSPYPLIPLLLVSSIPLPIHKPSLNCLNTQKIRTPLPAMLLPPTNPLLMMLRIQPQLPPLPLRPLRTRRRWHPARWHSIRHITKRPRKPPGSPVGFLAIGDRGRPVFGHGIPVAGEAGFYFCDFGKGVGDLGLHASMLGGGALGDCDFDASGMCRIAIASWDGICGFEAVGDGVILGPRVGCWSTTYSAAWISLRSWVRRMA